MTLIQRLTVDEWLIIRVDYILKQGCPIHLTIVNFITQCLPLRHKMTKLKLVLINKQHLISFSL